MTCLARRMRVSPVRSWRVSMDQPPFFSARRSVACLFKSHCRFGRCRHSEYHLLKYDMKALYAGMGNQITKEYQFPMTKEMGEFMKEAEEDI